MYTPVKDELRSIAASVAAPIVIDKSALEKGRFIFEIKCINANTVNVPKRINASPHNGILTSPQTKIDRRIPTVYYMF